jgi:hypothetical protein
MRKIEVIPAVRLQHLNLKLDGGGSSVASTPLPYPKSKSTSSLEDGMLPTSSNLISVSTTSSSSSLLIPSFGGSGGTPVPSGSVGPCGGFSTQYAWMCDLLGLPYREEVAWVSGTYFWDWERRKR